LHSDQDQETLILLHLFALCEKALLYYCSPGVSTVMLTVLLMSLISILCTSLTLQTKTYSLAEVCAVMSALLVFSEFGTGLAGCREMSRIKRVCLLLLYANTAVSVSKITYLL